MSPGIDGGGMEDEYINAMPPNLHRQSRAKGAQEALGPCKLWCQHQGFGSDKGRGKVPARCAFMLLGHMPGRKTAECDLADSSYSTPYL